MSKIEGCTYPDCFNCKLSDCIAENEDIPKLKREDWLRKYHQSEKYKEYQKAYKQSDKYKQQQKEYWQRQDVKDRANARRKKARSENPLIIEKEKAYKQANKEKISAYNREYGRKRRERQKMIFANLPKGASWRDTNFPERMQGALDG